MNRRNFIRALAAGVTGLAIDPEQLIWTPSRSRIFVPSLRQSMFYGIPYHQSDVFTGQWLGISRNLEACKEIEKLISRISEAKLRESRFT